MSEAAGELIERPAHWFTRENARELQEKGLAARKENARNRRLLQSDTYRTDRLLRVRKQLERIDQLIESESDARTLDRLASAQARLSAQEFALAGRPMPGAFRPVKERAKKESSGSLVPLGVSNAA